MSTPGVCHQPCHRSCRLQGWVTSGQTTNRELINEFGKVAGYKINTQKSVAFLYTNDKRPEREIKETISFINTSETIKYLGINLPKETKDLYSKNYKTMMRQSIPRQNDKKSGTLGRRQESGILKEEERTTLISPLHSLVLVT